jgi:hypothetical protein
MTLQPGTRAALACAAGSGIRRVSIAAKHTVGVRQIPFFPCLVIGDPMNRPSLEGLRLNVPAHVKHPRLIEWVAQVAALTEAADVLLV